MTHIDHYLEHCCVSWISSLFEVYSPECVEEEFCEVRNTKQRTTHNKDSLYWGCVALHKPATLAP
jgi:hypothetical protein